MKRTVALLALLWLAPLGDAPPIADDPPNYSCPAWAWGEP
jgi:hypothetical protein